MNAMNSLFGALPMPGSGGAATPPPEAALPALIPTGGSFDDDSWADVEAPEADLGVLDALAADGSLAAPVIPGGDHYAAGHEKLIEAVGHLVDKDIPVAAICGATLLLARGGFLDERRHTSNAASYLEASGYRGGAHYEEAPVVTDRGVTTASGIHAVPFTAEVMRITGLVPDAMVDSWEQVFLNGKEKDYMALMEATVAWQNA